MKKTKRNLMLGQFNLHAVICLAFVMATPLMARDTIDGTADLDGDGDGDPVANGSTFNISDPPNNYTNSLIGNSSLNAQWWVSDVQITGYDDYRNDTQNGDFLTAHILDPIAPGSSFHILKNYEQGMVDYASNFRESTGNLPAGTNVYFGLSSYGNGSTFGTDVIDPGKGGVNNLTFIDTAAPTDYTTGQSAPYSWFHYTIDSSGGGVQTVWQINGDGLGDGALTSWIAVFELPDVADGFTGIGAGTDWALSGYEEKEAKGGGFPLVSVTPGDQYYEFPGGPGLGNPLLMDDPTTDVLFSWTVDSKVEAIGPTDPEFGPNPTTIPEPTSFLLVATGMMLFLFKRKR